MANYATLKSALQAVIKQNGNNEITGLLLQQALLAMVDSLGAGYQFIDTAIPSTNPGTPDYNVFYLATTAGTYTNFNNTVLADGEVAILAYNGSWVKKSTNIATKTALTELEQKVSEIENEGLTTDEDSTIRFFDDDDTKRAEMLFKGGASEEEVIIGNDAGSEEYAKVGDYGIKAKAFLNINGDSATNPPDTIYVDANGNGDYTSVADALANAGDTATRHITIIVLPGEYEMPPKVSNVAPYQEFNRNLTLRGVNRNKCILKCNIGFYDFTIGTDCATLRLCGNITIEGLTIISSNEQYNSKIGTPGYVTERTNRKAAYCIHLDQNRREGDEIVVRDCTLIDYQMAAIGYGTRKNSIIRIENCYIQSEQAAQDSEANNFGVVWGHNLSGDGGNVGGQSIELINNQLVHKTGNYAFQYKYAAVTGDTEQMACSYCLIGNAVNTQDISRACDVNPDNWPIGTLTQDPLSFGNQAQGMNV